MPETVRQIQRRKRAHLAIVLGREVGYRSIAAGFGDVTLRRPRPLPPDVKVDTSTVFLGRTIALGADLAGIARPFLIAADRGEAGELRERLRRGLVAFMRRAGARSIDELGKVGLTVGGETARTLDAARRRSIPGRISVTPPR